MCTCCLSRLRWPLREYFARWNERLDLPSSIVRSRQSTCEKYPCVRVFVCVYVRVCICIYLCECVCARAITFVCIYVLIELVFAGTTLFARAAVWKCNLWVYELLCNQYHNPHPCIKSSTTHTHPNFHLLCEHVTAPTDLPLQICITLARDRSFGSVILQREFCLQEFIFSFFSWFFRWALSVFGV